MEQDFLVSIKLNILLKHCMNRIYLQDILIAYKQVVTKWKEEKTVESNIIYLYCFKWITSPYIQIPVYNICLTQFRAQRRCGEVYAINFHKKTIPFTINDVSKYNMAGEQWERLPVFILYTSKRFFPFCIYGP